MLRRKVKTSVVDDRINLEYGLSQYSIYRHNQQILRKLVCSPNREFALVCGLSTSSGEILYHSGQIYKLNALEKTVECFTLFGCGPGNLKKIYSFPSKPRWHDMEIWQSSTNKVPCKNQGHRPSLFIVNWDRYLIRRDFHTGVVLDKVFLSSRYKFIEILSDEEAGRLVLKSTRSVKSRVPGSNDVLMAMAVFLFPHLEFQGLFEIKKSIFGKTAVDGVINQGILLILHSDHMVKLYSLEYILSEFTVLHAKLGDTFDHNGTQYVLGQPEFGLPVNVRVTETPPLLMQVKTDGHQLQIGGQPWHYICHPVAGKYVVCDLNTQQPIENGLVEQLEQIDVEQVMFHPDDSPKIIHLANSQLLIYRIVRTESGTKLDEWFTYDAKYDAKTVTSPDEEQKSSFGRPLARPRTSYLSCVSMSSDLTFSYENELDLFGILTANDSVDSSLESMALEEILIYDNNSGELVKKVPVNKEVSMSTDVASLLLSFDGSVLVARVKENQLTNMFVFKLCECNVREDNVIVPKPQRRRSSRRRSTEKR